MKNCMTPNRYAVLVFFIVLAAFSAGFNSKPLLQAASTDEKKEAVVVLTSSEDWRYPMIAAGFAARNDYIFLTNILTNLDYHNRDEMKWVERIIILGNEDIISGGIEKLINDYRDKTMWEGFEAANVERISGKNLYESAALLADRWSDPKGIIIVRDDIYQDALVAGQLSAATDSPILFTHGNTLPKPTLDKIRELKLPVTIIGDPSATAGIDKLIEEAGVSVNRIGGATPDETATLVGDAYIKAMEKQGKKIDSFAIVNGAGSKWYGNLAFRSYFLNSVIIYSDYSGALTQNGKNFLDSHYGIQKALIMTPDEKLAESYTTTEKYLNKIGITSFLSHFNLVEKSTIQVSNPGTLVLEIARDFRLYLASKGILLSPTKSAGGGGGGGGAEGGSS